MGVSMAWAQAERAGNMEDGEDDMYIMWLCGKHEYLLVLVVIDNKHHCLRAFREVCLIKTKNWLSLVLSSATAVGVESDELMEWIERVQISKEE